MFADWLSHFLVKADSFDDETATAIFSFNATESHHSTATNIQQYIIYNNITVTFQPSFSQIVKETLKLAVAEYIDRAIYSLSYNIKYNARNH